MERTDHPASQQLLEDLPAITHWEENKRLVEIRCHSGLKTPVARETWLSQKLL